MHTPKGISLVTVLVVVAILAVVAAFAIPGWRNHQIAVRTDQALRSGDAAKLVVMEAVTTRGGLINLRPGDLSYNAASTSGPYVSKIDISQSGRITIVTKNTGSTPDPTFLLTPIEPASNAGGGAPLGWNCDIIEGSDQAKPASCTRQSGAPTTTVAHPASGAPAHALSG
jgi:type IV pilus assembly protein PilA